jgi:hypothetical protein
MKTLMLKLMLGLFILAVSGNAFGQTHLKKDGTPDMRYKENKEAARASGAIPSVPSAGYKSSYTNSYGNSGSNYNTTTQYGSQSNITVSPKAPVTAAPKSTSVPSVPPPTASAPAKSSTGFNNPYSGSNNYNYKYNNAPAAAQPKVSVPSVAPPAASAPVKKDSGLSGGSYSSDVGPWGSHTGASVQKPVEPPKTQPVKPASTNSMSGSVNAHFGTETHVTVAPAPQKPAAAPAAKELPNSMSGTITGHLAPQTNMTLDPQPQQQKPRRERRPRPRYDSDDGLNNDNSVFIPVPTWSAPPPPPPAPDYPNDYSNSRRGPDDYNYGPEPTPQVQLPPPPPPMQQYPEPPRYPEYPRPPEPPRYDYPQVNNPAPPQPPSINYPPATTPPPTTTPPAIPELPVPQAPVARAPEVNSSSWSKAISEGQLGLASCAAGEIPHKLDDQDEITKISGAFLDNQGMIESTRHAKSMVGCKNDRGRITKIVELDGDNHPIRTMSIKRDSLNRPVDRTVTDGKRTFVEHTSWDDERIHSKTLSEKQNDKVMTECTSAPDQRPDKLLPRDLGSNAIMDRLAKGDLNLITPAATYENLSQVEKDLVRQRADRDKLEKQLVNARKKKFRDHFFGSPAKRAQKVLAKLAVVQDQIRESEKIKSTLNSKVNSSPFDEMPDAKSSFAECSSGQIAVQANDTFNPQSGPGLKSVVFGCVEKGRLVSFKEQTSGNSWRKIEFEHPSKSSMVKTVLEGNHKVVEKFTLNGDKTAMIESDTWSRDGDGTETKLGSCKQYPEGRPASADNYYGVMSSSAAQGAGAGR